MTKTSSADFMHTIHDPVAYRAGDGYFGWTDRYGIRPSFFENRRPSSRRPYYVANF